MAKLSTLVLNALGIYAQTQSTAFQITGCNMDSSCDCFFLHGNGNYYLCQGTQIHGSQYAGEKAWVS